MSRRSQLVVLAVLVGGVVVSGAWYAFVPPRATASPALQPFQIEPEPPTARYRVVSNATVRCANASRIDGYSMTQVSTVDVQAAKRRTDRVVTAENRTVRYTSYQNGSVRFRRIVNGSASPTYERDAHAPRVEPAIYRHLPIYPQLLRSEWRPVSTRSGRERFRPRQAYWVEPVRAYGIEHRQYIAETEGLLVTTTEGTLLELTLEATTIRAQNRFERVLAPMDRCSMDLAYHLQPTSGPVESPQWVSTARTAPTGS